MDQGEDEPSEDFQSKSHVNHSVAEDNRSTDLKKRKLSEKDSVDVPSSSHVQSVPQLPSWVAGGSPPQFVAANELLQMSVAMDNLALVHEIAIDPEFSVSDIPKNPIQAAIKENMYRAYWDLLSEDLAKDPPDYTHAFNLLMEIKQTILDDILSVAHVRLRAEVNSVLDENSLRNKMEQGCVDVHGVGRFIVDLLGRLCAPERDTLVEKLRHEDGIFGLIDIMKNDLTNYTISKNRAAVEEYSSRFEYKEFMKYLEKSPGTFYFAYEWLKIAYHSIYSSNSLNSPPDAKREKVDAETVSDEEVVKSTSRGYLRLIETENPSPYPETLRIDKMRLAALAEKFLQMNIVTSALFITCNLAGKQISESEDFKNSLKEQLIIITNDIEEKKVVPSCLFRFVSMLFRTLTENLEAVCEQCVVMVRKRAEALALVLSVEHDQSLREQMKTIADKNNKIRKLVCEF
uniref:T-complex protein 11-like protein 1 n=1 Tax=Angiostrongylus cantonensis TaxID=6313 RepID=A0A158PCE9_ANGCA